MFSDWINLDFEHVILCLKAWSTIENKVEYMRFITHSKQPKKSIIESLFTAVGLAKAARFLAITLAPWQLCDKIILLVKSLYVNNA